jgi:hypothetical protein
MASSGPGPENHLAASSANRKKQKKKKGSSKEAGGVQDSKRDAFLGPNCSTSSAAIVAVTSILDEFLREALAEELQFMATQNLDVTEEESLHSAKKDFASMERKGNEGNASGKTTWVEPNVYFRGCLDQEIRWTSPLLHLTIGAMS